MVETMADGPLVLKCAKGQILTWLTHHPAGGTVRELKRALGLHPSVQEAAVEALKQDRLLVSDAGSGLLTEPPHVLVADPPWPLKDKCPGKGRGARKKYRTMPIEKIKAFTLPTMHPDAWLFLWRVASMPEEALEVVRAWGFVPKAEIVWIKRDPGGKCVPGMGHYVRCTHETCIIAARGKAIPLRLSKRIPSFFEAARPLVPGTRKPLHSAKPDKFFHLVERLVRGPYLELFGRKLRDGWTVLGDELP